MILLYSMPRRLNQVTQKHKYSGVSNSSEDFWGSLFMYGRPSSQFRLSWSWCCRISSLTGEQGITWYHRQSQDPAERSPAEPRPCWVGHGRSMTESLREPGLLPGQSASAQEPIMLRLWYQSSRRTFSFPSPSSRHTRKGSLALTPHSGNQVKRWAR